MAKPFTPFVRPKWFVVNWLSGMPEAGAAKDGSRGTTLVAMALALSCQCGACSVFRLGPPAQPESTSINTQENAAAAFSTILLCGTPGTKQAF